MVRGYNPNESDPVKYLFDWALRAFRRTEHLPLEITKALVQRWFADSSYDGIFRLFRERGLPPPRIRLLSSCSERHFPAQWQQQTGTIGLCMKNIRNKI